MSQEINLNKEKEKSKEINDKINTGSSKPLYKDTRTSLTARLNQNDLPVFNQRLKLFGFNTLNEMVHDFIKGNFPIVTEDRQIDNLFQNQQTGGLKSLLEGGNDRDFYEKADTNDMHNYYLHIRKFHPNTCRDLISYFKRFRDLFFTERIEEIRILSPRIRSKIMDAFRKFGQYYLYKYNNDQCMDLVTKIIRRHSLSVGNTEHGKLYIVDDNYLENKLQLLFDMNGDMGLIVKFGLFSGLREDEMVYVYNKTLCDNLSGCVCMRKHSRSRKTKWHINSTNTMASRTQKMLFYNSSHNNFQSI